MVRNLLGSLLALIGAAAAAWSPYRDWYGGRLGRDFRTRELFTAVGVTDAGASLWTSVFLPLLAAGVLTVIAVLFRSRWMIVLAALIVLGFTVLWMVRQGQDAGSLTAGGDGLHDGVAYAMGGGVLMLLGALVMRGRGHPRTRNRGAHARGGADEDGYEREPYGPAEPYGTDQPYGADESYGEPYAPYEHEPYGHAPYGTPGPHGAYRADGGYGPRPGSADTPPEEWDPWERRGPGQPPQQGPENTRRMPRPDPRRGPDQGRDDPY